LGKIRKYTGQEVNGLRVFHKVDWNVPIKNGTIESTSRIDKSLPSIIATLKSGGMPIICSHIGRPDGLVNPELSTAVIFDYARAQLQRDGELLSGASVFDLTALAGQTMTPELYLKQLEQAKGLRPGQGLLLENIRFVKDEEKKEISDAFAQQLALFGAVYVNDAFGSAHRPHASNLIPLHLKGDSYAGELMLAEINGLGLIVDNPARKLTGIIGGAKTVDKYEISETGEVSIKEGKLLPMLTLLGIADYVLYGGKMANAFLAARGRSVGDGFKGAKNTDDVKAEKYAADQVIQKVGEARAKLVEPVDYLVTTDFGTAADLRDIPATKGIPEGNLQVDIGPESISEARGIINASGTVFLAGPMGAFDVNVLYAKGTREILEAMAQSGAKTVILGGDSEKALKKFGIDKKLFTLISTGGGAALEFIAKQGDIPALRALAR
jgi:phosphoglycerate kinase